MNLERLDLEQLWWGVGTMIKAKKMLFVYTETPLHVGSGASISMIDLPIQREKIPSIL